MRTPRDLSRAAIKPPVPIQLNIVNNDTRQTFLESPIETSVPRNDDLFQAQMQTIKQLQRSITDLQSKLDLSRRAFDNLLADRDIELTKAHDSGRAKGHAEVLNELEDLWRSQHFCLELLYGNFFEMSPPFIIQTRGADLTEKKYTHVLRLLF